MSDAPSDPGHAASRPGRPRPNPPRTTIRFKVKDPAAAPPSPKEAPPPGPPQPPTPDVSSEPAEPVAVGARPTEPPTPEPVGAGRKRANTRVLTWVVVGLIVAGGLAFIIKGANEPDDPTFAGGSRREPVAGFDEVAFRVNKTAQQTRCALLAQTDQQRAQGLMNRTDLAGYDGMIFVFPGDSTARFYMKDTPLPLSIAWFDEAGRFVSSTDMEPCLDRVDCPLYGATAPYRYALEVQKGGLEALGIGPGAVVSVGGPCA